MKPSKDGGSPKRNMSSPICIGHRGAKGHRPENTLSSFDFALQLGCPWIELDVYAVEDELLVIHDKRVDRTTNGSGLISEMSLEELRSLDAGDGQQIPTLDEVIALVNRRCSINVELKGPDTAIPVNQALHRYCEQGWKPESFLISSFYHSELEKADRKFSRGALFADIPDDWLARAQALSAWSVNFDQNKVTNDLVQQAHEADLKVLVYTANELQDIERVIAVGVDGVFSDFPDRVISVL